MKRVLIVPQLQSHLLSVEILENKLKQKSNYISYINTSNLYGYNFDKDSEYIILGSLNFHQTKVEIKYVNFDCEEIIIKKENAELEWRSSIFHKHKNLHL